MDTHTPNNNDNEATPGVTPLAPPSSSDTKKNEFRQYLERSGVIETFTKVLVGLYEEEDRHNLDAMEYVKQYLGAPTGVDWEGLKQENIDLKKQIQRLQQTLEQTQG